MKISWGIKIIITFAVFAAGIFTMVAVSMMNDTDLVSETIMNRRSNIRIRLIC
ncbi:MAG: hypothetical protein R3A12_08450 [Ignavibacteria bacterium]